jgi:hypothetical protein
MQVSESQMMKVEKGTETNNISKECPKEEYLKKLIDFAKEKGCPWVINNPDGINILGILKNVNFDEKEIENSDKSEDLKEESEKKLNINTSEEVNKSYAEVLAKEVVSPDIIQDRQSPFSSQLSGRGTPSPFTFNNLEDKPDKEKEKKNHEFGNEYYVTVLEMREGNLPFELKLYTIFSHLAPNKFDEEFVKADKSLKESISIKQVDGSMIYNVQVKRGWKLKQAKIKYIGTDKWVDNPKNFYGYKNLNFTYTKCNKRWKPEYTCTITNREGKKDKIILNESKVDNEELSKNKKVSQELYDLDNLFNKATKDGEKYLKIYTEKGTREAQVNKGWTVKEIKYIEISTKNKVDKVEKVINEKESNSGSVFSALSKLEDDSVQAK